MTGINFVFLSFGDNVAYHTQTYMAILTVLRHKREADSLTVYTDRPQCYVRIARYVEIQTLDKETIDKWMDGTGYIFRVKIEAIRHCAAKRPASHLLFMDGDTLLTCPPADMAQRLDQGIGLMHKNEGHPSRMKGASLRMWKAMRGQTVDGCTVSMKHNVWNSGVIAIPSGKAQSVCGLALSLCDRILESGVRCFTAEQYAFSVAMQEAGMLEEADRWILHYWGNKPAWGKITADFIARAHLGAMSVEEEIAAVDTLPMSDTPLRVRTPNTQRRLMVLVERLFPDKTTN